MCQSHGALFRASFSEREAAAGWLGRSSVPHGALASDSMTSRQLAHSDCRRRRRRLRPANHRRFSVMDGALPPTHTQHTRRLPRPPPPPPDCVPTAASITRPRPDCARVGSAIAAERLPFRECRSFNQTRPTKPRNTAIVRLAGPSKRNKDNDHCTSTGLGSSNSPRSLPSFISFSCFSLIFFC